MTVLVGTRRRAVVREEGATSCTKGETLTAFSEIHLSRKVHLANFITVVDRGRFQRQWSRPESELVRVAEAGKERHGPDDQWRL